jgi:ribosomal protein S18 acetylase RimI-like enzyme
VPVRRATPEDVPRIAAVLAEAFSTDPPMRWFLAASPRSPERLRRYFAALVPRMHMRHGEVWISDEPLGAAGWIEPGGWPGPAGEQLAMLPTLLRTFGRHPVRAIAGQQRLEQDHPSEPHWFLDYIGVEETARGAGTGSALMRPMLERCDAERVPAFLNAGSERSRDLYARHGFEVTERVELPFGGPPLWRMWRDPR